MSQSSIPSASARQPARQFFSRQALTTLSSHVILAEGYFRAFIAFSAGAVGALAMAPYNITPALIVTFSIAVWLLDGVTAAPSQQAWQASARPSFGARLKNRLQNYLGLPSLTMLMEAARDGWWLGFGYFVAGLWWLGAAFLVEADKFAWALPLGVIALPAILALFTAVGFMLAKILWSPGSLRILALAVGVGASEWLRGHVFTGFPWNLFGMALTTPLALAQSVAVFGIYGLTLLTIVIAASPALLADEPLIHQQKRRIPKLLILSVLCLISMAAYGSWRLGGAGNSMVKGVKLRIMQPNLVQDGSFNPANKDKILNRYLMLSDRAKSPTQSGVADATHLFWPESVFPFILARDAAALSQIGAMLPKGTILITGAARAGERGAGGRTTQFFNSIQVVGADGQILGGFDKVHLVPFGEYLPLEGFLHNLGLTQFVSVPGGFTAGRHRQLMDIPGLPPALPLICYEAIFPDEIMADIDTNLKKPGLIINVTDDAWFGNTPGPEQHFAMARLRAIEQGLPLVRAGNNGISAVIDSYGRIIAKLPLGVEDVLDSQLPVAIAPPLYTRHGDDMLLGLFLGLAVAALLGKMTSH